jgi:U3 small nucleolar RNA-associated protein 10
MIQQISRVVPALKILQDPKIALTTGKISKIWTALAQSVPLRVLIPTVDEVYQKISEKGNFSSIEPLMELSHEIFQHAEGKELKNYQSELTDFFTRALEFRVVAQSQMSDNEVNDLELMIIRSVIALVLKQSEGSFRPFFETLYEWGIKEGCQDGNYTRAITFFRLTNEISIALKSLFLLFASDVVDSAANLLNLSNISKNNENLCFNDNKKNLYLTEFILRSLHNIFLHDHQNFINSQRFEVIMQPVVDEIENELVVKDEGIQQLLRMTIAQLAVAASDDILWKQLNYQVLLKTRSDTPEVRILGLKASVDVAKKLGEDYEPLLPETIPFLSELLEDDNHKVVEACQNGVRELESTVGDSLQKYF